MRKPKKRAAAPAAAQPPEPSASVDASAEAPARVLEEERHEAFAGAQREAFADELRDLEVQETDAEALTALCAAQRFAPTDLSERAIRVLAERIARRVLAS